MGKTRKGKYSASASMTKWDRRKMDRKLFTQSTKEAQRRVEIVEPEEDVVEEVKMIEEEIRAEMEKYCAYVTLGDELRTARDSVEVGDVEEVEPQQTDYMSHLINTAYEIGQLNDMDLEDYEEYFDKIVGTLEAPDRQRMKRIALTTLRYVVDSLIRDIINGKE